MLDVIDLFGDRDTRDELGVGAIRDAFADLFFPGISTIQTRAKYFLFIPWIYLELERKQKASAQIADLARAAEVKLIDILAETEGQSRGVIGFSARHTLKRLPSNVYWQGLGQWGIRQYEGGQDSYHRSLDYWYEAGRAAKKPSEDEGSNVTRRNWHSVLPACPANFPTGVDFSLSPEEAEYLQERVLARVPNSLLAFFLRMNQEWDAGSYEFPWDHPAVREASPIQRQQLEHAEFFSLTMHGASILYNLLLSELAANEDWMDFYQSAWDRWADEVNAQSESLGQWDRQAFWSLVRKLNPRIDIRTERFVESWAGFALQPAVKAKREDKAARTLIEEREKSLKRGQARVVNKRALELWGGSAGAGRLNFRWGKAQQVSLDILRGLKEEFA